MAMYVPSEYNYILRRDSDYIIFNMISGAIMVVADDVYSRFASGNLTRDEVTMFANKQILKSHITDEKKVLEESRINCINDENRSSIRIWPTSFCNASCSYCFEKGIVSNNMSQDVIDQSISFLAHYISYDRNVSIEWFGGEPLLCIDTIEQIISRLKTIEKRKNVVINHSLITNGSLIDDYVIEKMIKWGIRFVQISFDGFKDSYSSPKYNITDDENIFDRVIHNIKKMNGVGIKIGIRINFMQGKKETLISLIRFLGRELSGRDGIDYYIYPVWNPSDKVDTYKIISREYISLMEEMIKCGLGDIRNIARLGPQRTLCRAKHYNSFSIFPDGSIGKCDEAYERVIGNVWEGITDREEYKRWTSELLDSDCSNCDFLPLCQGGCRASEFTGINKCFFNKELLNDILIWYTNFKEVKIFH